MLCLQIFMYDGRWSLISITNPRMYVCVSERGGGGVFGGGSKKQRLNLSSLEML